MAGPNTGCGCMTSRTGCLVIGWLEVILLFPLILGGITLLAMGAVGVPESWGHKDPAAKQVYDIAGIFLVAFGTLYTAAPACLLYGATKGKPTFVMGYGVCAILKSIATLIAWMCLIGSFGAEIIGYLTLSFVIEVYKAFVVFCHYNYLTEQRRGTGGVLRDMSPLKTGFTTVETGFRNTSY